MISGELKLSNYYSARRLSNYSACRTRVRVEGVNGFDLLLPIVDLHYHNNMIIEITMGIDNIILGSNGLKLIWGRGPSLGYYNLIFTGQSRFKLFVNVWLSVIDISHRLRDVDLL